MLKRYRRLLVKKERLLSSISNYRKDLGVAFEYARIKPLKKAFRSYVKALEKLFSLEFYSAELLLVENDRLLSSVNQLFHSDVSSFLKSLPDSQRAAVSSSFESLSNLHDEFIEVLSRVRSLLEHFYSSSPSSDSVKSLLEGVDQSAFHLVNDLLPVLKEESSINKSFKSLFSSPSSEFVDNFSELVNKFVFDSRKLISGFYSLFVFLVNDFHSLLKHKAFLDSFLVELVRYEFPPDHLSELKSLSESLDSLLMDKRSSFERLANQSFARAA